MEAEVLQAGAVAPASSPGVDRPAAPHAQPTWPALVALCAIARLHHVAADLLRAPAHVVSNERAI